MGIIIDSGMRLSNISTLIFQNILISLVHILFPYVENRQRSRDSQTPLKILFSFIISFSIRKFTFFFQEQKTNYFQNGYKCATFPVRKFHNKAAVNKIPNSVKYLNGNI